MMGKVGVIARGRGRENYARCKVCAYVQTQKRTALKLSNCKHLTSTKCACVTAVIFHALLQFQFLSVFFIIIIIIVFVQAFVSVRACNYQLSVS